MKCPVCNAPTRVLETRNTTRRRECFNLHRFTTEEAVVGEPDPRWLADARVMAREVRQRAPALAE